MTQPVPDYLRLYREQTHDVESAGDAPPAALAKLCQAFERATGWSLQYTVEPVAQRAARGSTFAPTGNTGIPLGQFSLEMPSDSAGIDVDDGSEPLVSFESASELATAVAHLTNELLCTQRELRRCQAELAVAVPVVARREEPKQLADRLEAALQAGAKAVGCTSAALYLLDEQTAHLHLRAVYNLPYSRFTQGTRLLADAKADLEALCGHAVVLENQTSIETWCPPERCGAAICVPVSSPTVPLGTLWLYCDERRAFDDQQINVAEVVAGRLAADLEREVLLANGAEQAAVTRQLDAASRRQQSSMPSVPPLVEGWDLAGWTSQAGPLGGDFFDWWMSNGERLCLALGESLNGGIDAALTSATLRATLRTLAEQGFAPDELLRRASQALWQWSAGDQHASLWLGTIDPASGLCQFAAAGHIGSLLLSSSGAERLTAPNMLLGTDPTGTYLPREMTVLPGQVLVAVSDGVYDATDADGTPWTMCGLEGVLRDHLDLSAEGLAELVRDRLEAWSPTAADDRTILVVKRQF